MSQIPLLTDQGFGRPGVASAELPMPTTRSSIGAAIGYGLMGLGETGIRVAAELKESQVRTQTGMANVKAMSGLEDLTFTAEQEADPSKMVEVYNNGAAKLKDNLLKSVTDSEAKRRVAESFDQMAAVRQVEVRRLQIKRQIASEKSAFELQVQGLSRVAVTSDSPAEREAAVSAISDLYAGSSGRLFDSPEDAELARRDLMGNIDVARYNATVETDPESAAAMPMEFVPIEKAASMRAAAEAEARAKLGDVSMAKALNAADDLLVQAYTQKGNALAIARRDVPAVFADIPGIKETQRQAIIKNYQSAIETGYVNEAFLLGPDEAQAALDQTQLSPQQKIDWREKIGQLRDIRLGKVDRSVREKQQDAYEFMRYAAIQGGKIDGQPVTGLLIEQKRSSGEIGVDHAASLLQQITASNAKSAKDDSDVGAMFDEINRNMQAIK